MDTFFHLGLIERKGRDAAFLASSFKVTYVLQQGIEGAKYQDMTMD